MRGPSALLAGNTIVVPHGVAVALAAPFGAVVAAKSGCGRVSSTVFTTIIENHDVQARGLRLPLVRAHATGAGLDAEPNEQASKVERRFDGISGSGTAAAALPAGYPFRSQVTQRPHDTRKGIDGVSRARQVCVTVASVRSERDTRSRHWAEQETTASGGQFTLAVVSSAAASVRGVCGDAGGFGG